MNGIDPRMTEEESREWASRRWGCWSETDIHPHPTSIGDEIAQIVVTDQNHNTFRGIGYSGMAPIGVSVWAKAAADLLRFEPLANIA
jgi:hypothetical protein